MMISLRHRALVLVVGMVLLGACARHDTAAYIASGEAYLAKRDYNAAIIQFKNALNDAPRDARVRFLLGTTMLDAGDSVAAETELRKALDTGYDINAVGPLLATALLRQGNYRKIISDLPALAVGSPAARADVQSALGVAYLATNRKDDARIAIAAALKLQPDSVAGRIARVRLVASENDLPGALQLADEVVAAAPGNADSMLLKADLLMALDKRDLATKTLEELVAVRPDALLARYGLISNLLRSNRTNEATPHLEAVKKQAPGDPRTFHAEGLVAFARGDMAKAHEAVARALQRAPDYLPARYLSGLVDYRMGSFASAEESLSGIVARAPGDENAKRALAAVYLRRGQPAKSLQMLEPALRQSPADPALLRMVGETYLALNNPVRSAEYFEKAARVDSDNVAGRVRLAEVRLAAGETGQAVRDLESLSAADSSRREPDLALINAHIRARKLDKALAAALTLERKQPKDAVSHYVKAVVYQAQGDGAQARASYEKAVAVDPGYAAALYGLARLDVASRDFDAAEKRYQAILAKDARHDEATLGLAELVALRKAPAVQIVAALDRAVNANPASINARLALIGYHGRNKDWKSALLAAQAATAALPDSPQVIAALAAVQQAGGDNNQALETYRRVAKLQPNDVTPLLRMADLQRLAKDTDAALASMRSAVEIQPDNHGVWTLFATFYEDAGRLDAGLDHARRLQRQYPQRAAGYGIEGEIDARQRKWADMATAYRNALARQPLPAAAIRLHYALEAGGKADEATRTAEKWIKEHPQDVAMRGYLGERYIAARDFRSAAQNLLAAVEIEPDSPVLLNNLAWALGELGDPKATTYARHAYALAPETPAVADTYGWVLVRSGDTARGIEILRKAVALAPADAGKRLRLAKALLKSGDSAQARKELEPLAQSNTPLHARAEAERLLKDL